MTPVHVIWKDATSVDAWIDVKEALGDEAHIVNTIGYLISETKAHVIVALNVDLERKAVSQYIIIPRGFLLKLRKLSPFKD